MEITPKPPKATAFLGVRTTQALKERLRASAQKDDVSMSELVEQLLVWALARHEAPKTGHTGPRHRVGAKLKAAAKS